MVTTAKPPLTEAPIYVEYVHRGAHHHYDLANDTATERRPTSGTECWIDLASIPAVPPAQAPWPGGPVSGAARGVSAVPLGAVPGDVYRFAYQYSSPPPAPPFDHFANMVPANYAGGVYQPALADSAGRPVPYDPGVWVADGVLQVVEFKYNTPQQLGYAPPFTISYWRYVGTFAGSGLIANEGVGTGLIYDTTTAGVALLRTLLVDPAAGREGAAIATAGQEVRIGNTLTGLNIGPAPGPTVGRVFAQKNASAQLEYRELVAGTNVTIGETATTLVISASPGGAGISGAVNEGGGAQVFDAPVGTTLVFRTLIIDPAVGREGIVITQNATTISIGNTLTASNLGAGAAIFAAKTAGALLTLRSLIAAVGSGLTITAGANEITFDAAAGSVVTIANEGAGADVFDAVVGTQALLRRLNATANGLTITQNATDITFDNTLTGANVGAGTGEVFRNKTTNFLNLRTLLAAVGSGLTIVTGVDEITFDAAAGSVVTIANEGVGADVFDAVVGTQARLRRLNGTANGLTVTQNALDITFDNTLTGANLGVGTGTVFNAKVAAVLQFNSLAGTANGLTVSAPAAGTITIDNTLTGANVGAGTGEVFRDKTGALLNLRTLLAAVGSGLTIVTGADEITFDAAAGSVVTIANEGVGANVFDAVVGTQALLRRLNGTANGLTVTQNALDITFDNTLTGANLGVGTGTVFSAKVAAVLQFNSLAGTANGLTVSAPAAGTITIDNTLTGANVGAGTGSVFRNKTANLINLRTLLAAVGSGLTITTNADDITFDATAGSVVTIANEGAGAAVFDAVVGTQALMRRLNATANGLTITQNATDITFDNTLTGANVGAGTGSVFRDKTTNFINLRTLLAAVGSGLTIVTGADDITFSATAGSVVTIANEGAGAAVFDTVSGTQALLRRLNGTANGLTVTQNALDITFDNTLTGANLGAGTGTVFSAKVAAALQFNSLAGTANGLTVSAPAAGTITIDNTLTGANVGAGAGTVFSAKSGATLQYNTLAGTANGLTVSAPAANVITIDNTLTGANVGAGTGTIFSAKSGANLQLNTLAGTANGLTVSAPAANVITIDNTLTGANVGAGTGTLFSAKSGANLQFNTLAGSANGLAVSAPAANVVTISQNLNAWSIFEQQATGVNGGASVVGVQTRVLNQRVTSGPTPGNVTLAGNLITIQPGRYLIRGAAPCRNPGSTCAYLVDNGTGVTAIRGMATFANILGTIVLAPFSGVLTVAVATVYRVSHVINNARAADGLGLAVGQAGQVEIYTSLTIEQLA